MPQGHITFVCSIVSVHRDSVRAFDRRVFFFFFTSFAYYYKIRTDGKETEKKKIFILVLDCRVFAILRVRQNV